MTDIIITTSSPTIIDQYLVKEVLDFNVVSGVLTCVVDKTQALRLFNIVQTQEARLLVFQAVLAAVPV